MKDTTFYNALIQAIEKVYLKISLIIFNERMESYSNKTSSHTKSSNNEIKSSLLECIDKFSDDHNNNANTCHDANNTTITGVHSHEKDQLEKPYVMNNEKVSDLSNYFKKRNLNTEVHPGIEEKLERSIWEHIHSSIRYAGNGDVRNAKMHADIASSAHGELSHYMKEEYFQEFTMEIEKHLENLKSTSHNMDQ